MDLTTAQARVVGSLIEKACTTPDSYPLSSNALTNACNQTTNRDPVVDYTEREIDAVMIELREMKLARTVTGSGHRVGKHKHVVDEALGIDGHQLAVLAVLLLRGAQTRNEIVTRTERYADGPGGDADAVDAAIDRLAARPEPLAVRLDRQPGEREPRVDQCWAVTADAVPAAPAEPSPTATPSGAFETAAPEPATPEPGLTERVAALEATVAAQAERIDELVRQLGG
ncbi:MAG: DUF480 domain-containing protein [Actinomycetota bacterium]